MSLGTAVVRTGEEDDLRALARWLQEDDVLRGRVRLAEHPIQQGHMGGLLDGIVIVLTSVTAKSFVESLFAWLTARRTATAVTLTVRAPDGREVELTCGSAADAQQVTSSIGKLLDGGE
ncbi:hypothetical protein GCM10022247_18490 [Allokutzneria multivorans]|uniref:Uncharacterized protein n=2 Tax=Allokutzneria multivorans TaxID=1142134 RepID=A0ABP7RK77_9PSEU